MNDLRKAAQAALEALDAALPIIQYDAQMMADITRHAPLDPESQAKHDSTEYTSERLVRTIPQLLDALRAALAEPQPISECADNDSPWLIYKPCAAEGKCKQAQRPKPQPEASRLALLARAMGHPMVLEIMADCADCIATENSAQHDPDVYPYDGTKWVAMAAELRQQAAAIRAEDPDIWTTQAQQPLTDEQVTELRAQHGWAKETIRAIEAALRHANS